VGNAEGSLRGYALGFDFQKYKSLKVILFFANLNRKRISRIPIVFKTRITINQFLWLFFAALHKAIPFQTIDHASIAACKNGGIVGTVSIPTRLS
jgi:hypothetical protein